MTQIEKAILKVLADLTVHTTEIGKAQASMANFICYHLPNLSENEKQEMLSVAETGWLQVQSLQDTARNLQELLKN